MKQLGVIYYSPGTFCSEENYVSVERFNLPEIVEKAKRIIQRHGATPYGFMLTKHITGEDVLVDGHMLKLQSKETFRSGMFYITGKVMKLQDIPDTEENHTLRFNMKISDVQAVVENNNSYRFTGEFTKRDFVVNWCGKIVVSGRELLCEP